MGNGVWATATSAPGLAFTMLSTVLVAYSYFYIVSVTEQFMWWARQPAWEAPSAWASQATALFNAVVPLASLVTGLGLGLYLQPVRHMQSFNVVMWVWWLLTMANCAFAILPGSFGVLESEDGAARTNWGCGGTLRAVVCDAQFAKCDYQTNGSGHRCWKDALRCAASEVVRARPSRREDRTRYCPFPYPPYSPKMINRSVSRLRSPCEL